MNKVLFFAMLFLYEWWPELVATILFGAIVVGVILWLGRKR